MELPRVRSWNHIAYMESTSETSGAPQNNWYLPPLVPPQGSESEAHEKYFDGGIASRMECYFKIKSPYFPSSGSAKRWATVNGEPSNAPTSNSADHGNLSARHAGKMLVGLLDGSTEYLTLKEQADMLRWAPKANTKEWIPISNP